MLIRSFSVGEIPRLCMICPEPDAGAGFDPGLLPELLEHGLIDQLVPTKGQWQLIKKLTLQRQLVISCAHDLRQGNKQRRGKLHDFEKEMQKTITLEYELYSSLSLKQKQIAQRLLKDRDIL